MKTVVYGVFLLFAISVIVPAVVEVWQICLPLAIVMICTQISGVFKEVVRKVAKENKAPKQELVKYIAYLPVEAYIVYILLGNNMPLAIAYGVVVLVVLFLEFLQTQDEAIFELKH